MAFAKLNIKKRLNRLGALLAFALVLNVLLQVGVIIKFLFCNNCIFSFLARETYEFIWRINYKKYTKVGVDN